MSSGPILCNSSGVVLPTPAIRAIMDVAPFMFQGSIRGVESRNKAGMQISSLLLRYNVAVPVTYKAAHLLPSIPPLALTVYPFGSCIHEIKTPFGRFNSASPGDALMRYKNSASKGIWTPAAATAAAGVESVFSSGTAAAALNLKGGRASGVVLRATTAALRVHRRGADPTEGLWRGPRPTLPGAILTASAPCDRLGR